MSTNGLTGFQKQTVLVHTVSENVICQLVSLPQHPYVRDVLDDRQHGRRAKQIPQKYKVKKYFRVDYSARKIVKTHE